MKAIPINTLNTPMSNKPITYRDTSLSDGRAALIWSTSLSLIAFSLRPRYCLLMLYTHFSLVHPVGHRLYRDIY